MSSRKLALVFIAIASPLLLQAALDTHKLEQLIGLKGTFNAAEGVFKVTAPRNDLPITAEGSSEQLASGVKLALAKQKEIRAAHPSPAKMFGEGFAPGASRITGKVLEDILGTKGTAKDGMFTKLRATCSYTIGARAAPHHWPPASRRPLRFRRR